jgi:hypothetical protein
MVISDSAFAVPPVTDSSKMRVNSACFIVIPSVIMGAKNPGFGMLKKRKFRLRPDLRPCTHLIIRLLFSITF